MHVHRSTWPNCVAVIVGVACTMGCISSAQSAPIPEPKDWHLRLTIGTDVTGFKWGDPWLLFVSLKNLKKEVRQIDELETRFNLLCNCRQLSFVLRFEDGTVVERQSVSQWIVRGEGKVQPLAIPSEGEVGDRIEIRKLLEGHDDLDAAYSKCKNFCVTAIIYPLNIKSNTLFFNDWTKPKPAVDALKDAEEYRKKGKRD
jgi:hypothetical protein